MTASPPGSTRISLPSSKPQMQRPPQNISTWIPTTTKITIYKTKVSLSFTKHTPLSTVAISNRSHYLASCSCQKPGDLTLLLLLPWDHPQVTFFSHLDCYNHLQSGLPNICYTPSQSAPSKPKRNISHHSVIKDFTGPSVSWIVQTPQHGYRASGPVTCALTPASLLSHSLPAILSRHCEEPSVSALATTYCTHAFCTYCTFLLDCPLQPSPTFCSSWTNSSPSTVSSRVKFSRPPLSLDLVSPFIVSSPMMCTFPVKVFILFIVAVYFMSENRTRYLHHHFIPIFYYSAGHWAHAQ